MNEIDINQFTVHRQQFTQNEYNEWNRNKPVHSSQTTVHKKTVHKKTVH